MFLRWGIVSNSARKVKLTMALVAKLFAQAQHIASNPPDSRLKTTDDSQFKLDESKTLAGKV